MITAPIKTITGYNGTIYDEDGECEPSNVVMLW